MKWPFENDTSLSVRALARRSLKSDRKSALFLILTIAIAVAMVLGVALASAGLAEKAKDPYRAQAQVTVLAPTEDQLSAMRKAEGIDWVGEYSALGYSYQEGNELFVVYADSDYLTRQAPLDYTGALPQADDEVMLERSQLERMEQNAQPGDAVTLDLTGLGREETYILSGIAETGESDRSATTVYVSRKLAQQIADANLQGHLQITAYTRLATDDISADGITAFAENVLTPLGIDKRQIFLTDYFAAMNGVLNGGLHLSIPLLTLVTGGLAATIIYGVFYMMIAKNVQTLGQLRTIGMTTRQVKRMMRAEGRALACRGIALGLVLGLAGGFAVAPGGFRVRTALIYAGISALGGWCAVKLALWRPTRLAAKTSPLEGARYLGGNRRRKETRRSHRPPTPARLARINLGRHRAKTIFTICTLAASGILFLSVATVAGSIDAEKQARFAYYPAGDIELSLQHIARSTFEANGEYNYGTRLQLEDNPLSAPALTEALLAIPGVEKVTPHKAIYAGFTVRLSLTETLGRSSTVPVIDRDDFSEIAPLLSEEVDYDAVSAENAVLMSNTLAQAGDTVTIEVRGKDGEKLSYEATVAATYDPSKLMETHPIVPGSPEFLMTTDSATALTGVTDLTGVLTVACSDGAYESVRAQVLQMAEASDEYDENDISQTIANIEVVNGTTIRNLRVIAVMLFLFGGISMANMLVVDFQSRRRIFSLLAAVGASKRQLAQMLAWELGVLVCAIGLLSAIGAAFASSIACARIEATQHCITLTLPWGEVGAFLALLLLVATGFAWYARRQLSQISPLAVVDEE